MVQLTDELLAALDIEAARRGVSRSALIREILDGHLAEHHEAALSRAIVDGYRRVPPGTPDEWGPLSDLADRSALETLQRLDAEEAREGLPPW